MAGYTGSAGSNGYTGSVGGQLYVMNNPGGAFAYTVDGFTGNYPTLTVIKGELIYFDLQNITSGHPMAFRLASGDTSAVPGMTNNNPAAGNYATTTFVAYRVPYDAPSQIVYQCVYHSSMIGYINVQDKKGYTGSMGYVGSAGSGQITWQVVSSSTTVVANNGYFVDTTVSAISLTLPAAAVIGNTIRFNDLAGNFAVNNLTILRNGHKIQGVADDLLVADTQASFGLVYSNDTYGWKIMEV